MHCLTKISYIMFRNQCKKMYVDYVSIWTPSLKEEFSIKKYHRIENSDMCIVNFQ